MDTSTTSSWSSLQAPASSTVVSCMGTSRWSGIATHPMSWVCSKMVSPKIHRKPTVTHHCFFWNKQLWTNPDHENILMTSFLHWVPDMLSEMTNGTVGSRMANIRRPTALPGNRSHWVPWILDKHEFRGHMWAARTLWDSTLLAGNSTVCYGKIWLCS